MDIIKNPFVYLPLDKNSEMFAIKLLKVYPSTNFEAAIERKLLNSSLKGPDRIDFEALSYTWGNIHDPNNRGEILLRELLDQTIYGLRIIELVITKEWNIGV